MPVRRPTLLIGDISKTNMPYWRRTWLIHRPSINMPHQIPTCLIRDTLKTDMLDHAFPMGFRWGMLDLRRFPIRHFGHPWGISVSDGSPMRNVSLWCWMSVSDEACWSPLGLRYDMSVSNGSRMGLRWISVKNNIFVNSTTMSKKLKCFYLFLSGHIIYITKDTWNAK